MNEDHGIKTTEQRIVALAIDFHRNVEGEYGCNGNTCPGVQRLVAHFTASVGIGKASQVMERTPDGKDAVDPVVGAPHDGLRAPSPDASTTSPTHGGTPHETQQGKRDLLAEVISEIEQRGAELQWHLQGEPLLSSWLVKLREVQYLAAHGGTAPHPEGGK